MPEIKVPEVCTADDPNVALCTVDGVRHDYRAHTGTQHNRPHTWWRCVWCHAVTCGNYGEADPCMEPYHHRSPHRSRDGVLWPIGGDRR